MRRRSSKKKSSRKTGFADWLRSQFAPWAAPQFDARRLRFETLETRTLLSVAQAFGPETPVDTAVDANYDMNTPKIASDSGGDYVVVWQGNYAAGTEHIDAQRYTAAGVAVGSEFQVDTLTTGVVGTPTVAMDSAGDFVITWLNTDEQSPLTYGIYAQRYNSTGVAQGSNFEVNTYTSDIHRFTTVAMDAAGDFVIAWQSYGQDGSGWAVYAQRYNSTGATEGSNFKVNTYTTDNTGYFQSGPSVAMDAEGDFVVAWQAYLHGSGGAFEIYAQRYNSTGVAQGSEFRVNAATTDDETAASVAMDAEGDFVIAWDSYGASGPEDIFAQRYNSTGTAQGSQIQVNTYTSTQAYPNAAMDPAGDFVIAWESYGQDGSGSGVFAQRYSAFGVAEGSLFQVNTYTTGRQNDPAVAIDSEGDFVVAWDSYHQDSFVEATYGVYTQQYKVVQAGAVGSSFLANTYIGDQKDPVVASDSAGDYVIVWQSYGQDGSGYGIYAQRYNSTGVPQGSEFRVNTGTTKHQESPAVAMDSAGDFVITWFSAYADGTSPTKGNYDIYAQRYNSTGAAQGSNFQVNSYTASGTSTPQEAPAVAMDAEGDFIITWESDKEDGSGYGIYARLFNAAGTAQESQFKVNTYTTGNQEDPSVGMDSEGDFVIAWDSNGQDGSLYGVYAQRYNSTAGAQGSNFRVNTYTTGDQVTPSVAMDAEGDFVIIFRGYGILAQRYNASGATQGSNFLAVAETTGVGLVSASVAMDAAGDFVVMYEEEDNDNVPAFTVFGQQFSAGGVAQGGAFQVGTHSEDAQLGGSAAMDSEGDFVAAWASYGDGGQYGIYAQRYAMQPGAATSQFQFQVNTYTTGNQYEPKVASDSEGDYVVVWTTYGQDGSYYGIYAQRYNAAGVAQGSNFQVNTYTTGDQARPSVAMDSAGDFVVAWQSFNEIGGAGDYDIYAQRYNSGGAAQGSQFQVNTYTTGNQGLPSVAMDSAGDFVIAWESSGGNDGSEYGVYAQRYNSTGAAQGGNFLVNTYTTGSQYTPSVAMDSEGDFVIAWQSFGEDGSDSGIYAQRYNATGVAQGSQFLVNTYTTNYQAAPAVAMDAEGDFVIAWQSLGEDGGGLVYGVYAQRYNAKGATQGSQFQVNTSIVGSQDFPSVAMDTNGDFVIAWGSYGEDGNYYGGGIGAVYAQVYTAAGAALGSNFQVNTYTTDYQKVPAVAMDEEGDFVVAWQGGNDGTYSNNPGQDGSGYGVYARRYTPVYEFQVNTYTTGSDQGPKVASDAAGDYVVVWESYGQNGNGTLFGIYAQRYNAAGVAQGSNFQVDAATTEQFAASVAMDSEGDFVVAWEASDGSDYGIFAQRYNSSGVAQGSEFRVNSYTTGQQEAPTVAMDSAGDFVIAWTSGGGQDGSGYGVYAQRYNSTGATQGSNFQVNTYTTRNQQLPSAAMDSAGDFVIAWQSIEDGLGYGIYAQRYNSTGATQGSEFQVNTYTTSNTTGPSVAMDSAGDFVVAWQSYSQDGSQYGIYAQRYNASGATQGSNFQVNTYTTGEQEVPAVAMDSAGDFVITWMSYQDGGSGTNSPQYGIYGQRYNSAGVAQQSEFRVNSYTTNQQELPAVAMDSEGDFVVTWQSYGQGGSDYAVFARRFTAINTSTAPVVTTTGTALSYTANSGPQDVDPGVTVTDTESSNITSATVSISSGYVSGEDVLAFTTEGNISGSFTIASGTLLLTGTATVAQYQTALEAVTYDDVDHDATTAARTVGFQVYDGIAYSNTATRTVNPQADVVTKLLITGQPPATVTAGGSFTLTVTAEDAESNVVNTFAGSETVALVNDPGSSTLGGTLTVSAVSGVATFTGLSLNKVGSGYTLDVTNGTVTSATSSAISVTPGAATQLVITSQPSSTVTAGAGFGFTVTAEDANQNVATSFTGSETVSLVSNPGGSTLGGTLTVSAVSGVATFSALTLNKVGSGYTLGVTSGTLTAATSSPITVSAAAATKLLVSAGPSSISAGQTTSVVVTAEDSFGNIITGFDDTVTLADSLGGATFGSVSFSGGLATVSATLDTAGTQTITATDTTHGTVSSGTSNSITVSVAAAAKLLVSAAPSSISAGQTTSVVVTAEDAFNNVETAFADTVTLADSLGGATFGSVTFSGGLATVTATLDKAGTQTITATDTTHGSVTSGTSNSITVTATAVTKLLASAAPSSLSAGQTTSVTVTAEDGFNNVVSTFADTVTLADSLGGATFANVSFSGGLATVAATLDTAGTQTITASDTTHGSVTSGTSNSVTVSVAAAAKLLVSAAPASVSAGQTTTVTITAEDAFSNVETGFADTVTLADSLGGATFGSVSFSGGLATVTATLDTAGTQTITASDTTHGTVTSGTSNSITVSVAAAAKLLVSAAPASLSAGQTTSVVVTAEDAFNNVETGFADTVTLADSLGGATFANVSFSGGLATVTATLDKAGTQTITASDTTHGSVTSGTSNSITVSAAAATKLLASAAPASLSAGQTTSVVVTAEDSFNNVVSTFADTVTLADSLGGATFGNVSFSGGLATVSATLDTAGTQTVTATDTTHGTVSSGTSNSITVSAAAAAKLLVSAAPSSISAGQTTSVVVTAEDAFNNVETVFADTVTLADSLGGATFGGVSFSGGLATVTATLDTAGTQTITATDTTHGSVASGTSNSITVSAAAAAKLLVSAAPSTLSAGQTTSVVVTAEDAFNNVETAFADTVTLADSLGGATFANVSFSGGLATVTATLDTAGTQTITATDTTHGSVTSGTSNSITVSVAAAAKLLVSAAPSSISAGQTTSVVVTAEDAFNNVETAFADTVTLADSLGGATFANVSFSGGLATVTATLDTAGTQTITASDTTHGTVTSGTSNSITVSVAAAAKLLVSAAPASLSAGQTTSVVVTAEDAFNNVETGFADTVTLADSLGGATFANVSFSGGLATVTATLDKAGTQTITATDTTHGSVTSGTSNSITVSAAAATKLLATAAPTSLSAGQTTSVTVTAEDSFNNVVSTFADTVTLADSLGGATFANVSFSGGLATVAATLDTAGTQTITATDTTHGTVSSGTSNSITVSAAAAAKLLVTAAPSSLSAGQTTSIVVTAEDAFNNIETGFADTVTLADAAGGATFGGVTFSGGLATVAATLDTAGTQTITATDTTHGSVASGASNSITVTAAAATKLSVSASPASLAAGTTTSVSVTAEDAFNNVITGFADTVTLADSLGGATFGNVSFLGGKATITATLDTAGTQTITATDTTHGTVSGGTSNAITVGPAAAAKLLVSAAPASLSAGQTTSVVVTAEDTLGNVATGFSDTVTLADSLGGATFGSVTFSGGLATVSATLDTAGTQTIAATDTTHGTVNSGTSNSITVSPATAAKLLAGASPASLSAGQTTSVVVTAEDAFNNVATGFADTVTLADSLGGATFGNVSFSSGKATITATLDTAGTQTITATDTTHGSVTSGTSNSITVSAAAAAKLLTSAAPTTLSAGQTTSVVVTAEDAFNNVVTGFADTVTLADSLGGATFGSASFSGGVATISATLDTAGTQTITATDTTHGSVNSGTSNSITVSVPAAAKLVTSAAPTSLSAGQSTSVVVTSEDSFGNLVTGFADTVTLADSLGGATFGNVSFVSGKATVAATLDTAGTQTITATDSTHGSVNSGTSNSITVSAAAAAKLLVSASPLSLAAGLTTSISITAEDAFNNVVTGFADTVTLADSLGGATFGNVSFSGGLATVAATLDTAGTQTVTATDTTHGSVSSGTSSTITVSPAADSKLLVSAAPTSLSAGQTTSVVITAEDTLGNVATGFSDTVTLADSLGGATFASVSFSGGLATVTATLDKSGIQTITAVDTTAGTVSSGTSNSVTVSAAAATKLLLSASPTSTSAGQATSVVVTAEDAFNNVVTGFGDTVTLADSLGGATFGSVSFSGGKATVSATLDKAGTQTITAADTTHGSVTSGTSNSITVGAAAATKLLVGASPSSLSAGQTTSVVITAEDAFNNVVTGFADTVTLSDSLGGATFGSVSFSGGLATVAATLDTAGTQTITAADMTHGTVTSGTSNSITVTPLAAAKLAVSASPSSLSAGQTTSVVVTAEDTFNNVVTGFADTVTLSDSLGGAAFGSLSFAGGLATVAATLDKAGTQNITATDTTHGSINSGTSNPITVGAAAATTLLVNASPTSLSAGQTTSVVITAEDAFNNVVTGFADTVTLSDSLGGAKFGSVSFSGGLATVAATLDKAGTQTITATDTTHGTVNGGTSSPITVSVAATAELLVSAAPASLSAGQTTSVVVTAADAFGNVESSFSDTVTLTDSLGGATFTGLTFSGGLATATATLDKAGTQTVTATDTTNGSINSGTSNSITVTALAATKLAISASPTSLSAGQTTSVFVTAEDTFGNPASGFTDTVTLVDSLGGATFGSLSFSGGLATVSATLDTAGTQTITATDTTNGSISSVMSGPIVVNPAAPKQLLVNVSPTSLSAGQTTSVTITAEDAFNNLATGFSDTVTLADSLGGASFTGVSFSGGFATVTATLDTAGTETIIATDTTGSFSGTSGAITVTPLAATQLVFSTEPPTTVAADTGFGFTVAAEDQFDNIDPTFDGSVTVALSNNPGGSTLGGSLTVSATNGVASFSGLTLNNVDSGYTLGATSGTLASATSSAISVASATSTVLTISSEPTTGVSFSGGVFSADGASPNVNITDLYNALASNANVTITDSQFTGDNDSIEWLSGANLDINGIGAGHTLTITAAPTATTGNISIASQILDSNTSGTDSLGLTFNAVGTYSDTSSINTNGAPIAINAGSSATLGTSTASALNVSAAGTISETGPQTISGASSFTETVSTQDILLATQSNSFSGAISVANNGNVRDFELHNISASASEPTLPTGLRNLTLVFDNAAVTIGSAVSVSGDALLSGKSVALNAALAAGGTVRINSAGSVSQSAGLTATNLAVAASGNVALTAANNAVDDELAIHDAAMGAFVEWLDSDGFEVGGIAAALAAEDPAGIFGAVAGVSASGNFIALENTSGNMLLGDGQAGEGVTASGAGGDVRLQSAGAITQNSGGGGAITAGALAVVADGNVELSRSANTAILVAIKNSSGYVRFVDSSGFTVGTVGGVSPAIFPNAVHGVTTVGGDIGLQNNTGNLVLGSGNASEVVSATGAGGDVRLESAGAVAQTPGSGAITAGALAVVADGNVELSQSANTALLLAIKNSSGYVRFVDSESFTVGTVGGISPAIFPNAVHGVTTVGGDIGLQNNTGSIQLGNGNASEVVSATGAGGDVRLESAGSIVQTPGSGAITAGALAVAADGNVELSQSANTALLVAINNSSGYVRFVDSESFTVGTVGGISPTLFPNAVHGVTTVGGDIGLQNNTGSMQLGNGNASEVVSATGAGGDVRLESAGAIVQDSSAGGAITAGALGIVAAGNVQLSQSTNTALLVAIKNSSGYVRFVDSESFVVATVGGLSPMLFPNAVHGVTTVGGDIGLQNNTGSMQLGNGNASEVVSATGAGGDVRLESAGAIVQVSGSGAITAGALGVVAAGVIQLSLDTNDVSAILAIDDTAAGTVSFSDSVSFAQGTVGAISPKIFPHAITGVTTVTPNPTL